MYSMANLPVLSREQVLSRAPSAGAMSPDSNVSARYLFIPTIDVVDGLVSSGWLPVDAREQATRKESREGKAKHLIRFQRKDSVLQAGDNVLDLVLVNSHDRTSAFQLYGGVYRLVCSNGLMVGGNDKLFHHSVRHIGTATDDAIEASYRIADALPQVGSKIREWDEIELTPDERGVYARAAEELIYGDDGAPYPIERLITPRRRGDNPTVWGTFNTVQENVVKGGIPYAKRGKNGRIRRNRTRGIKGIDKDIRLNKALWTLTEEMAKIKGA